jgi:long-subunit fatty acid transport protein
MQSQIIEDAGMWNTLSVEKEFSEKFSLAIDEEFRLKENFSMLNLFYTNVGINYKITERIKVGLTYRLIEKWKYEGQYFSFRHRLMFDLGYKYKFNRWAISYRSRVQSELRDIYTSEYGKVPEWYWRHKIEVKYKRGDYSPYVGSEWRYQITDPRNYESDAGWYRARFFAGFDYDINKRNTIGIYYLIQREFGLVERQHLYILGVQYIVQLKE